MVVLALTACAPSTGLYLADLETPQTKRLAGLVEKACGKVLANRLLKESKTDLSEAEIASIIVQRGGTAIDCAEPALAYVAHIRRLHGSLGKGKVAKKARK